MTTTAATIRASIASRIAALLPASMSGARFIEHRYVDDFATWCAANPATCLRRFSVREDSGIGPADVSDALVEGVWQGFTVEVAYPRDGRFGSSHLTSVDEVLAADRRQIHFAVGTPAQTHPASAVVTTDGEGRVEAGPIVLGVLSLRAYYYRSAA